MYGISGPLCWLRTISDDDDCLDSDLRNFSLVFMVITSSPQLFCFVFSSLGAFAIVRPLLKLRLYGQFRYQICNSLYFIALIFLFAMPYSLLSLITTLTYQQRVYYTTSYFSWIVQTMAFPGRILLVLALKLKESQGYFCTLRRRQRNINTPRSFEVQTHSDYVSINFLLFIIVS
jgi:hypothetical protein